MGGGGVCDRWRVGLHDQEEGQGVIKSLLHIPVSTHCININMLLL